MRLPVFVIASLFLILANAANAQQKLLFASFSGSLENTFRKVIIPPFEKKHGVTIQYVAGNSNETLAKLIAQRGKQVFDVVMMDDGPMYQAVALGFCDRIRPSKELDDLYPSAKAWDGKAVGVGVVATGLAYNKKTFQEQGWPAPTSWNDLANSRFRGRMAGIPVSNGYGLHTLVMMARLNGGNERQIEPGFDAIRTRIKPNVLVWEANAGQMTQLFQSGEIALSVWGSGRVKALADTGFPLEFVFPKEGAVELMETICPVAGSKLPDASQEFVRYLLSPEIQAIFAANEGYGPTNRTTVVPPQVAERVPYGPEKISRLIKVDWTAVNEKRASWIERWAREIER